MKRLGDAVDSTWLASYLGLTAAVSKVYPNLHSFTMIRPQLMVDSHLKESHDSLMAYHSKKKLNDGNAIYHSTSGYRWLRRQAVNA